MVSCYSIYKVHPLAAANFDILAHHSRFVKNFFQVFHKFLNFFLCFSSCSRASSFIAQLEHLITEPSICQVLFSSFCKFLFVSAFFSPLSRALRYNSTHYPICQALFSLFFVKFFNTTNCGFPLPAAPKYRHISSETCAFRTISSFLLSPILRIQPQIPIFVRK